MNLKTFLKEKIMLICIQIILILIITYILLILNYNLYILFFIASYIVIFTMFLLVYEYIKKKSYFKNLDKNIKTLDKKFLLFELMEEPEFLEGKLFYEYINHMSKDMNDYIAKYEMQLKEYKEYLEMWVHEIKTPISAIELTIENNKSKINNDIYNEVKKVNMYVEQVLYYSKLNGIKNDFVIKSNNVKDMINDVLRKNANYMINNKVEVELDNLDCIVYCDLKWTEFIIWQIVQNAIKYKNDKTKIRFDCKISKDNIILEISDNGIGICKKDIKKIFYKGYTGENGRLYSKSTGMGLYICKKACKYMNLDIYAKSQKLKYTSIYLTFPISSMFNVTKM